MAAAGPKKLSKDEREKIQLLINVTANLEDLMGEKLHNRVFDDAENAAFISDFFGFPSELRNMLLEASKTAKYKIFFSKNFPRLRQYRMGLRAILTGESKEPLRNVGAVYYTGILKMIDELVEHIKLTGTTAEGRKRRRRSLRHKKTRRTRRKRSGRRRTRRHRSRKH